MHPDCAVKFQEVVIARRLRRGNLDIAAATSALKDSPAPTGLPRCARNDTSPATLNGYELPNPVDARRPGFLPRINYGATSMGRRPCAVMTDTVRSQCDCPLRACRLLTIPRLRRMLIQLMYLH